MRPFEEMPPVPGNARPRFAVFGATRYGVRGVDALAERNVDVAFMLDNVPPANRRYNGLAVMTLGEMVGTEWEARVSGVLIASQRWQSEMVGQLKALGLSLPMYLY